MSSVFGAVERERAAGAEVLIVEDDDGVRRLLQAILENQQISCECAGNGDEALAAIHAGHHKVVLLDLLLPGLHNGFEVLRDLKNRRPELMNRVIILTAVSTATLKDFSDGSLVYRLLRKPFDLGELVNTVRACGWNENEGAPS